MVAPKYEKRNRVNYGNEFLYTSFDATGYHFNDQTLFDTGCKLRNIPWTDCSGNLVRQLHRIQAINYGFTQNFKDANEFGRIARSAKVAVDSPDVTLEFEYFLADGYNEQVMGFIVDGETQALFNHLVTEGRVGQNFFIGVAPEGHDVIGANLEQKEDRRRVIGIGNAFLSQYAVTAELGSIPKARVSFDAFNIRSYYGACNLPIPAIDPVNDCGAPNVNFSLPDTYESFIYEKVTGLEDIVYKDGAEGLRPGDIKISIDDGAFFSRQLSGLNDYTNGGAHIQGFTINMSVGNTRIHRLGRNFEFARVLNFPAVIDVEVQALVSHLKEENLWARLCESKKHDLVLLLGDCRALSVCDNKLVPHSTNMAFYLKSAILDEESFTSSVSDNKIVNLRFTVPVGGADDKDAGFFITGKSFFPERPNLLSWGNRL
jgi:hypothetical protein